MKEFDWARYFDLKQKYESHVPAKSRSKPVSYYIEKSPSSYRADNLTSGFFESYRETFEEVELFSEGLVMEAHEIFPSNIYLAVKAFEKFSSFYGGAGGSDKASVYRKVLQSYLIVSTDSFLPAILKSCSQVSFGLEKLDSGFTDRAVRGVVRGMVRSFNSYNGTQEFDDIGEEESKRLVGKISADTSILSGIGTFSIDELDSERLNHIESYREKIFS